MKNICVDCNNPDGHHIFNGHHYCTFCLLRALTRYNQGRVIHPIAQALCRLRAMLYRGFKARRKRLALPIDTLIMECEVENHIRRLKIDVTSDLPRLSAVVAGLAAYLATDALTASTRLSKLHEEPVTL